MKMTHTFYLIAGISLAIIMLIVIIVLIKKKKIKSYKEELMELEGFGEKSINNLLENIELSESDRQLLKF